MLIGAIVAGLLLGLRSGGKFSNLATIQLRLTWLLFVAVIVRFGTEALLNAGVDIIDTLRLPLFTVGFAMLLTALWANRSYPGMGLAFVGTLLNAIVIVVNGGYMPIWEPALTAAGFTIADVTSALHIVVPGDDPLDFLVYALILGDVIPIPFPIVQNVASIGDVFLSFGLAFFLFASVVRVPSVLDEEEEARIRERLRALSGTTRLPRPDGALGIAPETGLAPALTGSLALERPLYMGAPASGQASPALAPLASISIDASPTAATAPPTEIPGVAPETLERVRRHPYVRLALNGSFTALWTGQLISLFGDRIHQVALAAAVFAVTGSVLASALVFVAALVPNLLFSPIAGTFVDRWDHKEVLIVSDLLRAATVLLIPVAIVSNVLFVYPFVFLLTTISIFFRPARVAILPRIVKDDELVTANSALWVGETAADIIGYPLAGLFVATLGAALPVAFWLDAVTYIGSAVLIGTIVMGPVRSASDSGVETGAGEGFLAEMKAGYRFLRSEPVLYANTIQASVAQLTVGVLTALTPAYALFVFGNEEIGWEAVYAFIETGSGIGNLVGGFLIGLVATRVAKGRMIIAGYIGFGLLIFLLGLSGNLGLALGLSIGSGVANMLFIIPSQALFQERTPGELMGRVVGFRFALVYGSMTFAMVIGGVLAEFIGPATVIAASGLVCVAAGAAGWFVPALRDA